MSSSSNKKGRRPWLLRIILWMLTLGIVGGLAGIAGLAGLFFYHGSDPDLPKILDIRDYKPKTVTRIFDRNGILIGGISAERRTMVPFKRIPRLLVKAIVASEDADFFKHKGLDYMGMLRAFLANVRAGRFVQGGSTITQQVVKTFFLSPARTIKRKVQEVILARRLESELSKEEILFLYLNQIYFGHGRYGVQEASRYYFGVDVDKISLGQIAMLAGLPQSPQRLSPLKHPERAKRRQLYVLKMMARHKFIDASQASRVGQEPIKVVRSRNPYYHQAPEFTDQVRAELLRTFGAGKLGTMGLDVHTSLDIKLQLAAREAVQWGLRSLDARQGYRRRIVALKGKRLKRWRARLKRTQKTISRSGRYRAIVDSVDDDALELGVDLGASRGKVLLAGDARYNPQNHSPSQRFKPGDLIWVASGKEHFRLAGGPQAAMVVMKPQTGEVLAMVGGYSFVPGSFNRAIAARRQPGSSFKPFVYGAALATGKYTAASIINDAPVVIDKWEPRNFDGTFRGPLRLRQALAHSINTVAARLIDDVGVDAPRKLAMDLGITTPLGKDKSLALGSSEVKVIDLATAYCGLANGGSRVEPQFILRTGDQPLQRPQPRPVMKPEVAFVLTSMMQSVVREGTARRARRLRRPVAGKTGTTNNQRDAWFAGFVPQMVAVVWVGFDTPRRLGRHETGGRASLPIWVRFMKRALRGRPKLPFKQPPGVVVERIDPESGLLAHDGATDVLEEYFVQGTEPREKAKQPDQVDPGTILMTPGMP